MLWTLEKYTPMGVFDSRIFYHTTPNPIDGSPEAVVDAGGRVNTLTINLVQRMWPIATRQILRLSAAGFGAIAAGVVVTSPPVTSPGSGPADADADALDRVTAVGLEQLVRESIIGPRLLDRPALFDLGSNDIATVALELCTLYAHPALTVDASNFPAIGVTVNGAFYTPEKTLADGLDELASLVTGGARWYVNADLELVFTV